MKSHPYTWLKAELEAAFQYRSLVESKEVLSPDDFGSAYSEWSSAKWHIRLVWDGKDGRALLEVRQQDGSWTELASVLTEADLEGAEVNLNQVQQWKDAILKLECS